MNDTSLQMQKKQFEIYQSKSIDEKFRMITEMMEYAMTQTKSVIKQWYPHKTELELQIEFFKFYYRDDFNAEKMNALLNKMKEEAVEQ